MTLWSEKHDFWSKFGPFTKEMSQNTKILLQKVLNEPSEARYVA